MIKLLLNPTLKLACDEEAVFLISEMDCFEFPLDYLPLLTRLAEPADIDEIGPEHAARLRHLGELRLLVNANLNQLAPEVAAYWLAKHYHPGFTRAQLELTLGFIGPRAEDYRARFAASYPECALAGADAKLLVYVTDDLLHCELADDMARPVLLIKVGGIKQSIGPVLSPAFPYSALRACIARPCDVALSVPVPDSVQRTADAILLSELYHLRVQAGLHLAANHVVEWNMARLSKRAWKVKQV